jgi:peroxiredoxin
MRTLYRSFVIVFSFVSCTNNNSTPPKSPTPTEKNTAASNKYSIKGTVHGQDSGWIFIAQHDTTGQMIGKMDSAKIINGKFEYNGEINKPGLRFLGRQYNKKQRIFSFQFFLGRGELTMEVYKDSLEKSTATGTKAQDEFNDFKKNYYPILQQSNNIWFEKQKAEKRHDLRTADSLKVWLDEYSRSMKQIVIKQAKRNPSSIVSAYLVKEHLSVDPDPDILIPIYSNFDSSVKNSFFGRQILTAIQAGKRTMIGLSAPAFKLRDKNGNMISLDSYKGKYTLVDFWASWCGPCRAENPNLVKAYNQFKSQRFDILSISLDDSRKHWLDAVTKDQLPWTQVSDLKGSKSEVKELYGIKSIPMNYLLDQDGKIIAKNLRGEELQQKLKEVIK